MNPERIKSFSDGVFAVAITLLVLQFQVPHVPPSQLAAALLRLWPAYASYLLSFAVVGVYWVAHWNVIHELHSGDRNLAWINIGFLACVAFIPFPADKSDDPPPSATKRYGDVKEYRAEIDGACKRLIDERYVLEEDRPRYAAYGTAIWEFVVGKK